MNLKIMTTSHHSESSGEVPRCVGAAAGFCVLSFDEKIQTIVIVLPLAEVYSLSYLPRTCFL